MKRLGIVLLIVGMCGLAYSMNLDTTVLAPPYFETDRYGIAQRVTPTVRYHNVGLMNEKQNKLILFGAVAVTGAVLSAAGSRRMKGGSQK